MQPEFNQQIHAKYDPTTLSKILEDNRHNLVKNNVEENGNQPFFFFFFFFLRKMDSEGKRLS
jgi:hypothetical protein